MYRELLDTRPISMSGTYILSTSPCRFQNTIKICDTNSYCPCLVIDSPETPSSRLPSPDASWPLRTGAILVRINYFFTNDVQFNRYLFFFRYTPPSSPSQAVLDAQANLEVCGTRFVEDVIDRITNGPRTLSEKCISRLFIVERSAVGVVAEYDMILCLTHYLGDGIATHQIGNLFFSLLGAVDSSNGSVKSDAQLWELLEVEWTRRWAAVPAQDSVIPTSVETRLSGLVPKFQAVAHRIDFQKSQERFIVSLPSFVPATF